MQQVRGGRMGEEGGRRRVVVTVEGKEWDIRAKDVGRVACIVRNTISH